MSQEKNRPWQGVGMRIGHAWEVSINRGAICVVAADYTDDDPHMARLSPAQAMELTTALMQAYRDVTSYGCSDGT